MPFSLRRGVTRWALALPVAVLVIGALLTAWTIRQADGRMREALLDQARRVARAVDPGRIKALSGTEADLEVPEYLRLKEQLGAIRTLQPRYRFLYLMGHRADGTFFFFVDSEPAGSADESPPGETYRDATAEFIAAFNEKTELAEGPETDHWGTWVSALVPILHPDTGDVLAFLGIDIDAGRWQRELWNAGLTPALLTLALLVIPVVGFGLLQTERRGSNARRQKGIRIQVVLTAVAGAALSFAIAWTAHQGEQRRYHEAFSQLADSASNHVADAIEEFEAIGLESLARFFGSSEKVTQEEFSNFADYLLKNPAISATGLIAAVNGEDSGSVPNEARRSEASELAIWQKDDQGKHVVAAGRPTFYPLVTFCSRNGGGDISGFDVGSIPDCRAALESAARSGLVTAAETSLTIADPDAGRGMPLLLPVYHDNAAETLRGFAMLLVRIDALLNQQNDLRRASEASAIDLALYRLKTGAPAVRIATTREAGGDAIDATRFAFIRPVLAFGKTFAIGVTPGSTFKALYPVRSGVLTGLAGLAITAALALVADFLARRREDLEQQVRERTAALQESEARLRAIFDSAADAIYLKDLNLRYTHCNKAYERIFGFRRDQVLGKTVTELFPLEDNAKLLEMDRRALSGIPNRSTWTRKVGETELTVDTTKAPVRDAQGNIVGMCGVSRDITEQVRLEDEKAQLEKQVRQAQKMESVGRLAGGVAHDFNNLLSVILGYTELVAMDLPEESESCKKIGFVRDAALRARDLTRQLLAFSRKQALEMKQVNLNQVVSGFEKLLQRLIGEDINLELSLAENPLPVMADTAQLEQVLMNLAVNARDAMADGGRLTIETAMVELDEAYARKKPEVVPGRYAMLAISDTGCGMPPETQALIFEPFFTTKEKDQGTGLGLATTYGIVKQHGGAIWVYSEPGRGTTFKIYLPLRNDAGITVQKDFRPQASVSDVAATVLVVEDDPLVRELVGRILGNHGYTVIQAETTADAVAMAEAGSGGIDLVLTDVVMPDMKGPEVFEKISRMHPGARVLYMSGYTDNVIVRHGVLKPGVRFLQKPFTVEGLLKKVAEVLSAGN